MSENSKTKYVCEFTSEQMRVVRQSLDLFSRIGMGQLRTIIDVIDTERMSTKDVCHVRDQLSELEPVVTGLSNNAYWGVAATKELYRIAWDIQQILRHCQSWHEHPEGGITVNFDPPLPCTDHPLCKVNIKISAENS